MDRFIVIILIIHCLIIAYLKSNMDRFIAATIEISPLATGGFKIQYG